METKAKILVVDDEEDICEILKYNLEKAGYKVTTVLSAEDVLSIMQREQFDLLMLDIMLGGISGLKLAQLLREDYKNNIPIIFISALDTEIDILKGFKLGGDDYISKPFSVNEVIARVGAVVARYRKTLGKKESEKEGWQNGTAEKREPASNRLQFDNMTITLDEKRVYVAGNEVFLTKKEMDILMLLAKQPCRVFSRSDVLKLVWKNESYVLERTVDVHMARLRKKLGPASDLIINRSGYGYCLQPKTVNRNG